MNGFIQAVIGILLLGINVSNGKRTYYTAAVFESRPVHTDKMTPAEIKEANLRWMEMAAEEAAQKGTDILVFAEYGVTPPGKRHVTRNFAEPIPDPRKQQVNPCKEKEKYEGSMILQRFSCMAMKHKMYIVGNLFDTQPCSDASMTCSADSEVGCNVPPECPEDGELLYNANVVFDREGTFISRYYKSYLYFEFSNTPPKPEVIAFETDFGEFAIIICFDLLFKGIVDFIKHHKINNVILSTHWFQDVLPFSSVEFQQAWALTNGVNFLAANKHVPRNGTLGSGIYHKDHGAIIYTYNPDGKMKLLIGNVSLDDSASVDISTNVRIVDEHGITEAKERGGNFPEQCYQGLVGPPKDMVKDYRCMKHLTALHSLKKLQRNKGEVKSCHNEFCCHLTYEADTMSEEYYLTAFDGFNDVYGFYKWKEETCMLIRCDAFEGKPCVTFPSKAKTVFKFLELKASFQHSAVYPTVTKFNHRLAPKWEWFLKKSNNTHILVFHSKSSDPLLKVGLLGRNYEQDPPFISFVDSEEFRTLKMRHPFSI